jgi:hypothetical protein
MRSSADWTKLGAKSNVERLRQDGRFDGPGSAGTEERVPQKEPTINDMTPRQILDATTRALDRVARRFAEQKPEEMSEHPPRQPIE